MSVGLEFRRVLSRSPTSGKANLFENDFWSVAPIGAFPEGANAYGCQQMIRSEERRVGKEGRCRWDWSSDVCSPDLPPAAKQIFSRTISGQSHQSALSRKARTLTAASK